MLDQSTLETRINLHDWVVLSAYIGPMYSRSTRATFFFFWGGGGVALGQCSPETCVKSGAIRVGQCSIGTRGNKREKFQEVQRLK